MHVKVVGACSSAPAPQALRFANLKPESWKPQPKSTRQTTLVWIDRNNWKISHEAPSRNPQLNTWNRTAPRRSPKLFELLQPPFHAPEHNHRIICKSSLYMIFCCEAGNQPTPISWTAFKGEGLATSQAMPQKFRAFTVSLVVFSAEASKPCGLDPALSRLGIHARAFCTSGCINTQILNAVSHILVGDAKLCDNSWTMQRVVCRCQN